MNSFLRKILPIKYPLLTILLFAVVFGFSWLLRQFFDAAGVAVICLFIGMIGGFKLARRENRNSKKQ